MAAVATVVVAMAAVAIVAVATAAAIVAVAMAAEIAVEDINLTTSKEMKTVREYSRAVFLYPYHTYIYQ